VRIQHFKQRFGKFRVVVVEPLGDARIKQGERFDHAFDVRVFAHLAADQQPAGDLGIALGEFAQIAAQKSQLALVVRQEIFHAQPPAGAARPALLML
jgi:hypothetical protein